MFLEIGDVCNEDKLPKEIKFMNYKFNDNQNDVCNETSDKLRKIDEIIEDDI